MDVQLDNAILEKWIYIVVMEMGHGLSMTIHYVSLSAFCFSKSGNLYRLSADLELSMLVKLIEEKSSGLVRIAG
ncbi:MAG TPA: hypothetical protein V6D19_03450 [Stenomitos sp.]